MRGMYISDTNRLVEKGQFGHAAIQITSFNIVLFSNQVFINKDLIQKSDNWTENNINWCATEQNLYL
jgi:hypothetical protein